MNSSARQSLPHALHTLVEVRDSGIHGSGVFARRRIAANTMLGIYEGRRYSSAALEAETFDSALTYLFVLSDGTTIDGGQDGNATRHLNHACAPNCEAREEMGEDGFITLHIHTLAAIPKDAELSLDYALVIDQAEDPSCYPCRCGHPACRGSMAAAVL